MKNDSSARKVNESFGNPNDRHLHLKEIWNDVVEGYEYGLDSSAGDIYYDKKNPVTLYVSSFLLDDFTLSCSLAAFCPWLYNLGMNIHFGDAFKERVWNLELKAAYVF